MDIITVVYNNPFLTLMFLVVAGMVIEDIVKAARKSS